LLKWQCQTGYRGNSWRNSWRYGIEEQRTELADQINDNPSLEHKLPEGLYRDYKYAVNGAAKETGLPKTTFPDTCPRSFEQIMDR